MMMDAVPFQPFALLALFLHHSKKQLIIFFLKEAKAAKKIILETPVS
jgi:hypothetical protein